MTVTDFAEGCRQVFLVDWIEVDGCIVRSQPDIVRMVSKAIRSGSEPRNIELLFNHVHMSHLFSNFEGAPYGVEDARFVAELLQHMIRSRLHSLFPEREFQFEVLTEDNDVVLQYCQHQSKR